mgnify:CR=1 FL=1
MCEITPEETGVRQPDADVLTGTGDNAHDAAVCGVTDGTTTAPAAGIGRAG